MRLLVIFLLVQDHSLPSIYPQEDYQDGDTFSEHLSTCICSKSISGDESKVGTRRLSIYFFLMVMRLNTHYSFFLFYYHRLFSLSKVQATFLVQKIILSLLLNNKLTI